MDNRYARHLLIDGWNQDRLRDASVLVAGAGAIGNEVIKLLALLGVGRILIVDFDRVEESNLACSVLFRAADIGRSKAEVAAVRAHEINPDISARGLHADLRYDLGLGVVRSMDLVIGGLDNLDSRLALNRACMHSRTPWLNGGIEVNVAEVSLFRAGDGACFECGMSPEMWLRRSLRYSCGGVLSMTPERIAPTTPIVAGLAAAYLAQEALYLLHAAEPQNKEGLGLGRKITVSLKPYETAVYTLPRNPECLAHDVFEPIEVRAEAPGAVSVLDVLDWAAVPNGAVELGFDLAIHMVCAQCGRCEPIRRPLDRCDESLLHCPICEVRCRRPDTVNWLDAGHRLSSVPLRDLCVPEHAVLSVRGNGSRRYFQLGGDPIWL